MEKLRKGTFWTKREKKHESKGENVEERGANMDKEQDAHQPTDMDEHENENSVEDLETVFLNHIESQEKLEETEREKRCPASTN